MFVKSVSGLVCLSNMGPVRFVYFPQSLARLSPAVSQQQPVSKRTDSTPAAGPVVWSVLKHSELSTPQTKHKSPANSRSAREKCPAWCKDRNLCFLHTEPTGQWSVWTQLTSECCPIFLNVLKLVFFPHFKILLTLWEC